MKTTIIPAKPIFNIPLPRRVAAYCRVSTDQEIQHHSLEAQREYYSQYISERLNWSFVEIYADQASGRHNLYMKEFQRMMADCRAGKIDYILVKSISRLGRNTVQFLRVCDELNALKVDVYFEVEKLHINEPKAVRMLTVYASLYQNESETKSYGVRWGNLVRFKNGSSKYCDRTCYGYCHGSDGSLEIVPGEAEAVRAIYAWHDEGCSLREIAHRLMDAKIKAPRGGEAWHIEAIRRILNNEKYSGDVCLQKTYIADYFTGKQVPIAGSVTATSYEIIIQQLFQKSNFLKQPFIIHLTNGQKTCIMDIWNFRRLLYGVLFNSRSGRDVRAKPKNRPQTHCCWQIKSR